MAKNTDSSQAVVAHSGGPGSWFSEFEASLIYRASSRTARPTQRNPVSRNQNKQANLLLFHKTLGSVLSTHMLTSNHLYRSSPGINTLFWPLRTLPTRGRQTHTHMKTKQPYTQDNKGMCHHNGHRTGICFAYTNLFIHFELFLLSFEILSCNSPSLPSESSHKPLLALLFHCCSFQRLKSFPSS